MPARIWQIACGSACFAVGSLGHAIAQDTPPVLTGDLADLCAADAQHPPKQWKISKGINPDLWRSRLSCDVSSPRSDKPAVRVTVRPRDAYEVSLDDLPTERVEIQIKKQVIKFDQPTWYRFSFRLENPWQGIGNRTVIHQVKQNIPTEEQRPHGVCPAANPLFKIEAIPSATGADFVVKVRGTTDCNVGASKVLCGPWHLDVGSWNDVNVMIKPSLHDGSSDLRVSLNGRNCDPYTGLLGYVDHGFRDRDGQPFIDVQPHFGIYRDALPDILQSIDFADIQFWSSDPSTEPAWSKSVSTTK